MFLFQPTGWLKADGVFSCLDNSLVFPYPKALPLNQNGFGFFLNLTSAFSVFPSLSQIPQDCIRAGIWERVRMRLRLYSHGETEIADTRVSSRMDTGRLCNWETQITCHTHTTKTEISESPSWPVQWISKNVSKRFIMSSDSRSDDDTIISDYYHCYRKRKTRRFWLHPYIEKNLNCSLFVAVKELHECDSKFLAFYRMKKDTYHKLMELITPAIHYLDSNMRECVSPDFI